MKINSIQSYSANNARQNKTQGNSSVPNSMQGLSEDTFKKSSQPSFKGWHRIGAEILASSGPTLKNFAEMFHKLDSGDISYVAWHDWGMFSYNKKYQASCLKLQTAISEVLQKKNSYLEELRQQGLSVERKKVINAELERLEMKAKEGKEKYWHEDISSSDSYDTSSDTSSFDARWDDPTSSYH